MKGFFNKEKTDSKNVYKGKRLTCHSCGLFKYSVNPKMNIYGKFKKRILIINDYPTKIDDNKNKLWNGSSGRLFKYELSQNNIDIFNDCYTISAINCRPLDKNLKIKKPPYDFEIQCCRKRVWNIIEKHKPKLILLVGTYALHSFLSHRWKKDLGSINKWRGFVIPDRATKCFVAPIFNPTHIIQDEKNPATKKIWQLDIKNAVSYLNKIFPDFHDEKNDVNIIDIKKLIKHIPLIGKKSIDYETTGLKPHAKGHRIVCGSICSLTHGCYSFMMDGSKKDRSYFIELLESKYVEKMAHNMKFEDMWSKVRLNTNVNNWLWDSMIGAKILDNRNGTSGLKFQTYVNFGVIDYDSNVSEYLESDDKKNANAFNNIYDCDEDELLLYCGLDTIYQMKLSMIQMEKLGFDDLPF